MKSFFKFKTFMFMGIVTLALLYYCSKYYQQGQLFFTKNQFPIAIIFTLLIFWTFGYVIWQNIQNQNQYLQLQKDNIIITDLLQLIMDNYKELNENVDDNHYNLVKMENHTRQLILDCFSKNDIKRGAEEYEGK